MKHVLEKEESFVLHSGEKEEDSLTIFALIRKEKLKLLGNVIRRGMDKNEFFLFVPNSTREKIDGAGIKLSNYDTTIDWLKDSLSGKDDDNQFDLNKLSDDENDILLGMVVSDWLYFERPFAIIFKDMDDYEEEFKHGYVFKQTDDLIDFAIEFDIRMSGEDFSKITKEMTKWRINVLEHHSV